MWQPPKYPIIRQPLSEPCLSTQLDLANTLRVMFKRVYHKNVYEIKLS